MILLQQILSVITEIPQFGYKCYYYDYLVDFPAKFNYKIIFNLNTRKYDKSSSDMNYIPDVALTVYDANNTEISYVQLDTNGSVTINTQVDGQIKACIKSLNQRQKLHKFGIDVEFTNGATQRTDTELHLGTGLNAMKAKQLMDLVEETARIQTEVRNIVDVEKESRKMESIFVTTSVLFAVVYVIFNFFYVRKIKEHFKDCKL
ncbi:Emp24/gp25L/p24_family/GOLD domain-containing protein [Hexamita inflata]|uniref:Emp24/gp25L/p24 family/GOLD domain-containing protein n=1 Tax=Hexamita inflata TaxID=28002 RepID=A0AA86R597_9EUKA|nr:Emp24/gp25L/p24 family/GOLD domain-containing protein [Hexamita inflata]